MMNHKGQKASVMMPDQRLIAWIRMVLAVDWMDPIVHSAIPFCQCAPMAQKSRC